MCRIVHVSDLHLAKPGAAVLPEKDQSILQRVTKYILDEHGVSINVKAHDPTRLKALETVLKSLNPDLILVTGDITTYGDRESMRFGAEVLGRWKAEYKNVYCVPGNHDALQERFVQLKSGQDLGGKAVEVIAKALRSFENVFDAAPAAGPITPAPFLDAYNSSIGVPLDTLADPSKPKWIETSWGWIALFLFNSVNDPGWMANEGRIGPDQFNQLNEGLYGAEHRARKDSTLRVALLHHHPLPIPYAPDTPGERFYDDMRDGSTMCHYLNKHDFHMVLHGHKHRPYLCRIEYEGKAGLYVIAAGSATQSDESFDNASFNVIDIVSPYHALFRRYGRRVTGFEPQPGSERVMNITPVTQLRYTPAGTPETEMDVDVRNFVNFNPAGIEENHDFTKIEMRAEIDSECNYRATYHLTGRVRADGVSGVRQVITGSPARTLKELEFKAYSGGDETQEIEIEATQDYPRQKCIELLHPVRLNKGAEFDYTYTFKWKQSGPPDKDFFDGFNLSYFRGEIGEVTFSITLPYRAAKPGVERIGFAQEQVPGLTREPGKPGWRYSLKLTTPVKVFYLVRLPATTNA